MILDHNIKKSDIYLVTSDRQINPHIQFHFPKLRTRIEELAEEAYDKKIKELSGLAVEIDGADIDSDRGFPYGVNGRQPYIDLDILKVVESDSDDDFELRY